MKINQRKMLSEQFTLVGLALFAVIVSISSESEGIRSSDCPEACHCDNDRHLVDCGYRSLVSSPLYVPVTVRRYTVAGNRIYWISTDSLLGLGELISLDLSENFISELPKDLFSSTPQLHILRLDGNRFISIPTASLLKLHNLQQLFLTRNKIISLSGETEFNILSLSTLDLSGNEIAEVPDLFLDRFPQLRDLRLQRNDITSLDMKKWTGGEHGLQMLDISSNAIRRIAWNDVVYQNLKRLSASDNLLTLVDASWFVAMPNLNVLDLCANLISSIADNTFKHASRLRQLYLCNLPNMQYIGSKNFAGLSRLELLDLSNNYNLSSIHRDAFTSLHRLKQLEIIHSGLTTIQLSANAVSLEATSVFLAGSQWLCDCRLKWMYDAYVTRGSDIGQDIVCSAPPELLNIRLFEVKEHEFSCEASERYHHVDQIVSAHISTSIILHCPLEVQPGSEIVWRTSRGTVIRSTLSDSEQLSSLKDFGYFVFNNNANISEKFVGGRFMGDSHFKLLENGSLIVKDVTRGDTGRYTCTVVNNHENVTRISELRLDYSYMSSVMLLSVFVGGSCALGLLLVAMIVGTVRHIANSCSAVERKKRRSLRELLSQMRNTSQLDRLSAYRAAKMDRLSAFKSATMDQLSLFTSERIGRLRKYKQSTVSCVLHNLERMREHYSVQMDHVKESYRLNAARIRHSYMARFRDSKSTSVRKQYRASVDRARTYTNEQIARLREQYKQQQQYLLKLLELIDVGSCVSSSIEAECIRAESAIFDATVEFDEEARPSYASRPDDRGLFASTSSLPGDCRHNALPAVSPSVDFCDVDDYCADQVTVPVRASSAPNVQACKLAVADCDDPFLRVPAHSNSTTTIYCHKAPSSPAVVNTAVDTTDVKLRSAPE